MFAASAFYKHFDKPIERVVIAAANPIVTFQNADMARNFGIELEGGHQVGSHFFFNANYTFVDSKITLAPEQLGVQTSSERPLAGSRRTCSTSPRVLRQRLLDAAAVQLLRRSHRRRRRQRSARHRRTGAWQARPGVLAALRGLNVRLNIENLTDSEYLFTQTLTTEETQRLYKLGRTVSLSFGYNVF